MEIYRLNRDFIEESKIIGKSKVIKEIEIFIKKVAQVDHPVLISGETGVGKELVAQKIHKVSYRRNKSFIPVNCANLSESLIESELFGYRKGAFTDAKEDKAGLIEEASEGTLFFDEISELSLYIQAKLLRLIEHREIRRLGETKTIKINFRFISATNKDLKRSINAGKFRKDLYYRISTLELYIPALRERKEDIPLLVENILRSENQKIGKNKKITEEALNKLLQYYCPGNIRELENIIKSAFTLSNGDKIREKDISLKITEEKEKLNTSEKLYIEMVNEGKSFWEAVHSPFLKRELNRREVKEVIDLGLKKTKGTYKKLLPQFNIDKGEKNYKKFMDIIRIHRLK